MAVASKDTRTTAQDADAANKATSDQSRIRPKGLLGWFGTWPLFASIATWVILAVGVLLFLVWLWTGKLLFLPNVLSKKSLYDVLKIALTTVGGIGGVAFLVMKYQDGQRDRHEEQRKEREEQRENREEQRKNRDEIHARMQAAIEQLGNEKSSVRIAGVYALTEISDRERGDYRQRVVDILCGYLRSTDRGTPISSGSNTDSAVAPKETDTASDNDETAATPDIPKPTFDDRPVESTIFSVMRTHLLKERRDEDGTITVEQQLSDNQLWCGCDFDFHGATFTEAINLDNTSFESLADFRYTHFLSSTSFYDVEFAKTSFNNSIFEGEAYFNHTQYTEATSFKKTYFKRAAYFIYSTFNEVDFSETHFINTAFFGNHNRQAETIFRGNAIFDNVRFHKEAHFYNCKFLSQAYFDNICFKNCYFCHSSFHFGAVFNNFKFIPLNNTEINTLIYNNVIDFNDCKFKTLFKISGNKIGPACFDYCIFYCQSSIQGIRTTTYKMAKFNSLFQHAFPSTVKLIDNLPEGAQWIDEEEDSKSGKADE